jgi:hypothetical protein
MKIFKSPQRILIIFLSVLIIISFIMIVRLEGKAASLQAQWEEHQKSLKANEDVLQNLDAFSRLVKKNAIKVDGSNVLLLANNTWVTIGNDEFNVSTDGNITLGSDTDDYLGYDSQKDLSYIKHQKGHITVGDIYQDGKRHGILLQNSGGKNSIVLTDDIILIESKAKDGKYRIDINPDKQIMSLKKGNSFLKFEKDDIQFGASPDIYFQYDTKMDLISMLHINAHVSIGDIYQDGKSHGVLIQTSDGKNTIMVSDQKILLQSKAKDDDYRIDIIPGNKTISLTKGKSFLKLINDNMEVEANGDINITSKNGNVNIKGKKVNLNK